MERPARRVRWMRLVRNVLDLAMSKDVEQPANTVSIWSMRILFRTQRITGTTILVCHVEKLLTLLDIVITVTRWEVARINRVKYEKVLELSEVCPTAQVVRLAGKPQDWYFAMVGDDLRRQQVQSVRVDALRGRWWTAFYALPTHRNNELDSHRDYGTISRMSC